MDLRGLSPRARGKRAISGGYLARHGPIPASAGETRLRARLICRLRAYPRERGGNLFAINDWFGARGLSPRARGKPSVTDAPSIVKGPIPASAGETGRALTSMTAMRAYPRERGGNGDGMRTSSETEGLSPRARGKP